MSTKVHIVSHTHWDREWYLSFQEYRTRLVKVLGMAIEQLGGNPLFKCFMLDGQTSPLEDYFEVRPDQEPTVRRLIASGKLKVGPWYTQPDESLVSPEAIVRNLMVGHRMALDMGGVTKIGYLPDTFCHIPQIAQILRGFDIDNFIFQRGMGDEGEGLKTEFLYRGPDGSDVIAIHLITGYCNANMLGMIGPYSGIAWASPHGWRTLYLKIYDEEPQVDLEEARATVMDLVQRLRPLSSTGNVLLMNGCDHMPPQSALPQIVEYVRSKEPAIVMEQSTLEDFIKEVRERTTGLQTLRVELRGARYIPTLAGVYSTRTYLKQLNFRSQAALELYAEPIATMAMALACTRYPKELFLKLWKMLLLNHAHDSIYGSGVDHVHRENETRFVTIIEGASNAALEAATAISKRVSRPSRDSVAEVVVFNTLNWSRTEPVSMLAPIAPGNYVLVDAHGAIPVLSRPVEETVWGEACLLDFITSLPPLGYRTYSLLVGESRFEGDLKAEGPCIENSVIRVEADPSKGGCLKVTDKVTGRALDGLNGFVDEGDAGDEYNYSPPSEHDTHFSSAGCQAEVRSSVLGSSARLNIHLNMSVPSRVEGQRRSADLIEVPITAEVSIHPGSKRIDVKTEIENRAKDHRLRVAFPADVITEKSVADYHYQAIERDVEPRTKGVNWIEVPPSTHPQLGWVDVNDGTKGLMIANRGITEYEVTKESGRNVILLTLIRAVGWLSRDDLITRKGHAGPGYSTPEAECLRRMTFEYSIIPHDGDWLASGAYVEARNFAYPPLAAASVNPSGEFPTERCFLRVDPKELVVTALKMWEDGDGVVIRFYNVSTRPVSGTVEPSFRFAEAWSTNLNEEPRERLEPSQGQIRLTVGPNKAVTLLFKEVKMLT